MRRMLSLTAAALLATAVSVPSAAIAQDRPAPVQTVTENIEGTLADGTAWLLRKPANWNGSVVLDLDGAGSLQRVGAPPVRRPSAFVEWLLARGYAYGGITREPVGYDFPKAIGYMLDVRAKGAARWGKPKQTLVYGGSRGGFVVRKALELHPDIFDGGLMHSGGGAGEIAVLNNKLNGLFVLKTLVDPASPVRLVGITDMQADIAALGDLVKKANATPAGRARLALAGAVQQFSLWSSRGKPRPAPGDHDAAVDQMAENMTFATAIPVRAGVEKVAGGNVSWNHGVDYAALLDRSGRRAMVEALYAKAGIDLKADLATLAAAPRIAADPAAVHRIEPLGTYTGRIKDPVVNIDNDDPVDPASDKLAYLATLKRARTDGLFRLIWSDLPGHGGQSDLDRAVAFRILEQRIKNGRWADTSLAALGTLAADTAKSSTVDLGKATFFAPVGLPRPAAEWDAANWGRYAPPK